MFFYRTDAIIKRQRFYGIKRDGGTQMRKKSLSHKIITGFLVSFCLPLVVFLIFWVYQIGKIQEENVERQIENDIAGILSEIAYRVQEMDTTARSLAANPQIIDYLSNYSQEPEKYLLEAMGNFGSFIASVDQINPRIEAMRIYALDEAIPRYQNTIYPKRVMAQKAWMQRLEHLGYDAYFIGKSAKLYSAQNDENYRELIFPRNEMGPSVFSMYRQIYGVGSTKPVGYLEICMRTEDMVGVANTLMEGVDILFYEEGNGVLYSLKGDVGLEKAVTEYAAQQKGDSFQYGGQNWRLYSTQLQRPQVTLYYTYPVSVYHQVFYNGIWMVVLAILGAIGLMLIFLKVFFREVPERLQILVKRMQEVRAGSMEVEFSDDQEDEISEVNRTLEQMLQHINQLINRVYRVELSEKEATLRSLRMQMDPHFLFNALEAIRMSVTLGYYDRVEEALVALSSILRRRLRDDVTSTIAEEVETAREYIKVENLRYNDRILMQTEVDESLEKSRIPALTVQPLVNNAVRHGFTGGREYLMIRVEIMQEAGNILIRVTDNGAGMNEERLEQIRGCMRDGEKLKENAEHGTGLVNLAMRLRLKMGQDAEMQLDSIEGSGTQVEIRLKDEKM